MAIDATEGGASANSYVTLAEAGDYIAGRLQTSAWDDASDDLKERALREATRRLDLIDFRGTPATGSQSLAWPRFSWKWLPSAAWRRAGWNRLLEGHVLPREVKQAQIELAVAMLEELESAPESVEGLTALAPFKSASVGSIKVEMRDDLAERAVESGRVADSNPLDRQVIADLLRPFLMSPPGTIRLVRA